MSWINSNAVNTENIPNFFDNGSTSSFHTIMLHDLPDVIRINFGEINVTMQTGPDIMEIHSLSLRKKETPNTKKSKKKREAIKEKKQQRENKRKRKRM